MPGLFSRVIPRTASLVRGFSSSRLAYAYSSQISTALPEWTKTFYWNDKFEPNEERFTKVLIANRGEIACRVMQTCRRLGIKTVAVHSEIDAFSKHVQLADEAVCIGPAASKDSYLRMDKILDAVNKTGAQAVHPGYGFLSENTVFAAKLAEAGVTFVGPNSKAIHGMGDKLESKRVATKAKVNMIPGYDGEVDSMDQAAKIAAQIGFPVMIKASAGGGGKGMRIAWNEKEARDGFRLSREEARSSFGDDRMLIEKYIDGGRHIEIQLICDKHGNGVYLNERECSIQRRNQKVLEEAPSTFVTPEMRKAMGQQAVALALAVGYDSAGTVEFLVDSKRNFYFLEMNTRLQVEHPISEATTGIDVVHQMLRVAKGNRLLHKQSDISVNGHSIECRVCAEDPYKAFGLPAVGRLRSYVEPTHIPNVRVDSGIREGSEISVYYDPLISKLITFGPTRTFAVETMKKALDSYVIRGVTHNIPLLRDILTEPLFLSGDINTKYLPTVYPDGFKGKHLTDQQKRNLVSMACVLRVLDEKRHFKANNVEPPKKWDLVAVFQEKTHSVNVVRTDCGKFFKATIRCPGVTYDGQTTTIPNTFTLSTRVIETTLTAEGDKEGASDKVIMQMLSHNPGGEMVLQYFGTKHPVQIHEERVAKYLQYMPKKLTEVATNEVKAPMPGLLKALAVKVGQLIGEGQEVCVLEAMKMQNSLLSTKTSKVKKINFKVGDSISEDDVIIELE